MPIILHIVEHLLGHVVGMVPFLGTILEPMMGHLVEIQETATHVAVHTWSGTEWVPELV